MPRWHIQFERIWMHINTWWSEPPEDEHCNSLKISRKSFRTQEFYPKACVGVPPGRVKHAGLLQILCNSEMRSILCWMLAQLGVNTHWSKMPHFGATKGQALSLIISPSNNIIRPSATKVATLVCVICYTMLYPQFSGIVWGSTRKEILKNNNSQLLSATYCDQFFLRRCQPRDESCSPWSGSPGSMARPQVYPLLLPPLSYLSSEGLWTASSQRKMGSLLRNNSCSKSEPEILRKAPCQLQQGSQSISRYLKGISRVVGVGEITGNL